jgi:proteasome lid subunit RPN8/RPN11
LRFTPTAWAKLQFFCHAGDTEVGGFAITEAADLLLVTDFITVRQRVSCVTVAFDDEAVADFFDAQVDAGRKPEQFGRAWVHTHPGNSPTPSMTDEATFQRAFGSCDWAIMAIVAKGGQTYARLRFNVGPGGQMVIPVAVDYTRPFSGSDHDGWAEEYLAHIEPEPLLETLLGAGKGNHARDLPRGAGDYVDEPWDIHEELEAMAADGLLQE